MGGGDKTPPVLQFHHKKTQLQSPFHNQKTAKITITRIALISPITKQKSSNHHHKKYTLNKTLAAKSAFKNVTIDYRAMKESFKKIMQ